MEFRSPFGLGLPSQPPLVGAPGIPPLPPGIGGSIQPPLAGSVPKSIHHSALGVPLSSSSTLPNSLHHSLTSPTVSVANSTAGTSSFAAVLRDLAKNAGEAELRKAAAASSSFYPPGAATNSLLAAHAGLAPPNHLGLAAYPPLLPPGGVSSSISGTPSVNTGSISSLLPPPIAPPLPPIAVGVGISPNPALNGGVKSQMKNSNSLRSPSGGGIARIGGSQKAAVSPANPSPNHLDLRKGFGGVVEHKPSPSISATPHQSLSSLSTSSKSMPLSLTSSGHVTLTNSHITASSSSSSHSAPKPESSFKPYKSTGSGLSVSSLTQPQLSVPSIAASGLNQPQLPSVSLAAAGLHQPTLPVTSLAAAGLHQAQISSSLAATGLHPGYLAAYGLPSAAAMNLASPGGVLAAGLMPYGNELDAVYLAQLHHYAAMTANAAAVSRLPLPPHSLAVSSPLQQHPSHQLVVSQSQIRPPSTIGNSFISPQYNSTSHQQNIENSAAAKQRLAAGSNLKVPGVRMQLNTPPNSSTGTREDPIDVIDPDEIKVVHEVKKNVIPQQFPPGLASLLPSPVVSKLPLSTSTVASKSATTTSLSKYSIASPVSSSVSTSQPITMLSSSKLTSSVISSTLSSASSVYTTSASSAPRFVTSSVSNVNKSVPLPVTSVKLSASTPNNKPESNQMRSSTPKCLFVRPFEDSYSPIAARPNSKSPTNVSVASVSVTSTAVSSIIMTSPSTAPIVISSTFQPLVVSSSNSMLNLSPNVMSSVNNKVKLPTDVVVKSTKVSELRSTRIDTIRSSSAELLRSTSSELPMSTSINVSLVSSPIDTKPVASDLKGSLAISTLTSTSHSLPPYQTCSKLELPEGGETGGKVEDQDSDYESMSSDHSTSTITPKIEGSSIKRESLSESTTTLGPENLAGKAESADDSGHDLSVVGNASKIEDVMCMEGMTLCPTSGLLIPDPVCEIEKPDTKEPNDIGTTEKPDTKGHSDNDIIEKPDTKGHDDNDITEKPDTKVQDDKTGIKCLIVDETDVENADDTPKAKTKEIKQPVEKCKEIINSHESDKEITDVSSDQEDIKKLPSESEEHNDISAEQNEIKASPSESTEINDMPKEINSKSITTGCKEKRKSLSENIETSQLADESSMPSGLPSKRQKLDNAPCKEVTTLQIESDMSSIEESNDVPEICKESNSSTPKETNEPQESISLTSKDKKPLQCAGIYDFQDESKEINSLSYKKSKQHLCKETKSLTPKESLQEYCKESINPSTECKEVTTPPESQTADIIMGPSRREKLSYLGYLNLTTHSKKNDIEIAKLERRKELLRDRSPSPPPPTEPRCPSPSTLPILSYSDDLQTSHMDGDFVIPAVLSDSPAKSMYLSALGLCRQSEEQKTADEIIWSAVLDNRVNHGRDQTTVNQYYKQCSAVAEEIVIRAKRRYSAPFLHPSLLPPKEEDTFPEPKMESANVEMTSLPLFFPPQPSHQWSADSIVTVPDLRLHHSTSPRISAPSSIHLAHSPSNLSLSDHVKSEDSQLTIPLSTALSMLNGDSDVFGTNPHASMFAKVNGYSTDSAANDHINESDDEVPVLNIREDYEESLDSTDYQFSSPPPPCKRRRITASTGSQGDCSSGSSVPVWPGIEAMVQSYKKYQQDCETEKAELINRNSQLAAEILSQRSQAENLRTRLAGLTRLQQTLVNNGQIDQDTITRLITNIRAISQAWLLNG